MFKILKIFRLGGGVRKKDKEYLHHTYEFVSLSYSILTIGHECNSKKKPNIAHLRYICKLLNLFGVSEIKGRKIDASILKSLKKFVWHNDQINDKILHLCCVSGCHSQSGGWFWSIFYETSFKKFMKCRSKIDSVLCHFIEDKNIITCCNFLVFSHTWKSTTFFKFVLIRFSLMEKPHPGLRNS